MPLVHRPADAVTAARAVLAIAVAVIGPHGAGLLLLVAVALALDAVDGRVARRTGTASPFGARFDMETDAFLIAVLSAYAAPSYGWWVLAIGAARYALWLAERVLPWLRRPVPPRRWRKVVAAVQGVALALVLSGLLPHAAGEALLVIALGLLAESFGRDVWWLWRTRYAEAAYPTGGGITLVAIAAVWVALVLPRSPGDLLHVPVEAVLLLATALLPWRRARILGAVAVGLAAGAVVLLEVLDAGFERVMDRPFDPVTDWVYLGPGVGVLGDSIGATAARATAAAAAVLAAVVLMVLPLAALRVSRAASAHARVVLPIVVVLVLAVPARIASTSAAALAYDQVVQVRADLADRRVFGAEVAEDRFRAVPGDRLLQGLRGKDVLVVFVESYGRVAVQGTSFSPGVDAVLDRGTRRLRRTGYAMRSAFLTSPTFGAASWLAHSTTQSGLWVDSQQRYEQLLGTDRLTLTSAFDEAGWRTVLDVPANTRDWPEGAQFYGFDRLYDSRDVGYAGPRFGYATMPDQYTLAAFERLELDRSPRRPVMAEIDLVSSHHPWAPSPDPVAWRSVGDGSVFAGVGTSPGSSDVGTLYARSVEYTMGTLVSWLATQPDPDLVLLVLGDHQPHSYVTGPDPGHDVPVSLISRDHRVVDRIDDWGWDPGLHPGPGAPTWPMDAIRDRFLSAFSSSARGPTGPSTS